MIFWGRGRLRWGCRRRAAASETPVQQAALHSLHPVYSTTTDACLSYINFQ